LVAGPIERTGNILPQLKAPQKFRFANLRDGFLLILWGLMKKMVIADNLAMIVNGIYNAPTEKSGLELAIATLCFAFQIYCDFSAYSDIARGSARIMGIKLMRNFDFPYGARSIKDFWRRWHISLSTWFKDYLYFPLGGSRVSRARHCLNILIVFTVSGLWHGAAVTFILWGLLHGLYQVFGILTTSLREKFYQKILPKENLIVKCIAWVWTFLLVNFAWIFFRANSASDAFYIIGKLFSFPWGASLHLGLKTPMLIALIAATLLMCLTDLLQRKTDLTARLGKTIWRRYLVYFILIIMILLLGYYGDGFDPQDFVYFQF
jgi:D-alanyl-lipoteichoic acid acyltransferase DltB (MBOAT superfamily)